MSNKSAFVLVHGGLHGAWTWTDLTSLLAEVGFPSLAFDLPGAGSLTQFPRSFLKRPLDIEAFAKEVSPISGVTQDERTDAAVTAVNQAANLGNGKVILVGHSWGGLTISHVAEAIPEKLQSLVYLTALLIPNGLSGGEIFEHPSFDNSEVLPLFIGDSGEHGAAMRMDPRSEDPEYIRKLKDGFYHDVPQERVAAIANLLHCDEPADTATALIEITAEKFGSIERHYIRMADDRVLPPEAQDYMIERIDTSGIGGTTKVHNLSGGHSPMFANPRTLRDVLVKIAG
ncbi:MAG: alpha/beta fold hydrolase [Proteobacteria bacterium]|nr:MAG: alpha/beta fold hydrolase [Pseudomonadota bacterium]